jgi:glycosyltransferase involved in cell wall biosynthesis
LSIVLSEFNRRDAEKLTPRRVIAVAGGIPDPCPQFETEILPRRRARITARNKILSGDFQGADERAKIVNVLFLAHCTREKGAFDAIEGVALANKALSAEKSPLCFRLTLAGAFASDAEEKELRELAKRPDLREVVEILGFVSTERKGAALREADIFCFPTFYLAESQPSNLIEALAFGLPVVTTRWRAIPEMLPPDYPGLVDPKSPGQIAQALRRLATEDSVGPLREMFLSRFTLERHLANMAEAFRSVEE